MFVTLAKAAVSIGLIWYLVSRYAPGRWRLSAIDLKWCSLAFIALFATIPVASERWRRIIVHYGGTPDRRVVFKIFYTSAFFSQVLPSIGGDLVRVVYHRRLESKVRDLLISVLLDRGMGIAGLLVLAAGSYPLLSSFAGGSAIALPVEIATGCALVGACAGVFMVPVVVRSSLWQRVPSAIRATIEGVAWALSPAQGLFRLLPLSVLVHLFSVVAIYAIGRALGITLSFSTALGVGPLILLAQVLPISIGGWGVRETAAVALLTALGADSEAALALSIIFGALFALATLPGLVCWFSLRE